MQKLAELILAAYDATDRHIPDSDLDNEQPLTLDVRLTLGDIRQARRWLADVAAGARLAEQRETALREYDANL